MNTPLREVVADALPSIEQQARELLASALDECGRPTDAAEVRVGRNPFVRGEYALTAIAAALRTPASEGDGGRVVCCVCGVPVDTRENGTPGAELNDGRWVCSGACWERATADTPPTQQEARAVDGAMLKRAMRAEFNGVTMRDALMAGTDWDVEVLTAAITAALHPGAQP